MALTEVRLPALGEGITEATITRWLVKKGDKVTTDTPLVEIATDKVDTEVMSPVEGTIAEILLAEQSVPKIGQVLLRIFTEKEVETGISPEAEPFAPEPEVVAVELHAAVPQETEKESSMQSRFVPPFIRYLALSEGIGPEELEQIPGSGLDGLLTRDDILNYVLHKKPASMPHKANGHPAVAGPSPEPAAAAEVKAGPGETIIPMDRIRKMIAKNMVDSKRIAPHVTVFSEADITPMVEWRNKNKELFKKKYNENLTFTPLFVEAVAKAIRDFPGINISVKDDYIIKKDYINIGMAVALPDGNLIVPVIKNAGMLNLPELARQVNDLSGRARQGKLKPVEIQDGTFTITNIGSFGNISGTPVIYQPQAAILAIGTITKKPAAVQVNGSLGIGLRDITTLSLSFDHRAVDGALGGSFLQQICNYLTGFDTSRLI